MTQSYPALEATISPRALDSATSFYTATIPDILAELLQNARRADATTIDVEETVRHVRVTDDGHGIADPRMLLTFGASDWQKDTVGLEHPAGMGFWSLSRRTCEAWSCTERQDDGRYHGWHVEITPEVFAGRAKAQVEPLVLDAPETSIVFTKSEGDGAVKPALEWAAEYFPIPVRYSAHPDEPVAIARAGFLDDAVHVEPCAGGRIGVMRDAGTWSTRQETVCFNGLIVNQPVPVVDQVDGPSFTVGYDLTGSEGLELVLPARKELIVNDTWRALQEAGRRAIFRHIAKSQSHTLSFKNHEAARALGVTLAQPRACLSPYAPPIADGDNHFTDSPRPIAGDALLMDIDAEPHDLQCLAWAYRDATQPVLCETEARYEGYRWYDRLPAITDLTWTLTRDGKCLALADLSGEKQSIDGVEVSNRDVDWGFWSRPDTIIANLTIEREGKTETRRQETDLLLIGEEYCWVDDIVLVVKRGAEKTIDPGALADLIVAGFFSPSDDADADPYDTQRFNFTTDAVAHALRELVGEDAARIALITTHAEHYLSGLCPRDRELRLTIKDHQVSVTMDDPPENNQAAA